jgi:ubiquinone/menaquinone biosynthesis C-methylase UbiE
VSERLRSVVEQLDIRLDDRVLEIGCGHGVAATLVCQRLETGHLTAIDRSEKMIRAAARRNAPFVEAGRTEFLVADLEDFDPGERRFDKIFAVRGASAACRWHIIRERSGCTTAAPTFWAS